MVIEAMQGLYQRQLLCNYLQLEYEICNIGVTLNEPRHEKTGLRGFRPGPTQTGMYSHRKRLEA